MTPVFIYALNCPLTGIIRYCGQTIDPDKRFARHIRNAHKDKYHCARWVNKLLAKKLRPTMEILDVVPDTEADFWEREYIQNFRERGFDLTNITPGGASLGSGKNHPCFGKKQTPEHRMKIGIASKGRKLSPETCEKIRQANLGKTLSPEHRKKLSAAHKGKKQSSEHKAKISAGLTGIKRTPENCAGIGARQLGIKKTLEHCAAMRAGWKRKKESAAA